MAQTTKRTGLKLMSERRLDRRAASTANRELDRLIFDAVRAYWDDEDADFYNLVEAARELNSSGLALKTTSLLANALAALAEANGQSADELLAELADR